jgi:hypothetical protein
MKTRVFQSLTKHEIIKQNESLERQSEQRRIERLQQVLMKKMSQTTPAAASQAA